MVENKEVNHQWGKKTEWENTIKNMEVPQCLQTPTDFSSGAHVTTGEHGSVMRLLEENHLENDGETMYEFAINRDEAPDKVQRAMRRHVDDMGERPAEWRLRVYVTKQGSVDNLELRAVHR